jgi:hypothetical protein
MTMIAAMLFSLLVAIVNQAICKTREKILVLLLSGVRVKGYAATIRDNRLA